MKIPAATTIAKIGKDARRLLMQSNRRQHRPQPHQQQLCAVSSIVFDTKTTLNAYKQEIEMLEVATNQSTRRSLWTTSSISSSPASILSSSTTQLTSTGISSTTGKSSSICGNINAISRRWHNSGSDDGEKVNIKFILPSGEERIIKSVVGNNLLQVAHKNDLDLEGACEGVCACSTCHLIFDDIDLFNSLSEASEDEEDMLDMAFGLEETSRLGCQVHVTSQFDNTTIRMPKATRNFYVDGHVPKPH